MSSIQARWVGPKCMYDLVTYNRIYTVYRVENTDYVKFINNRNKTDIADFKYFVVLE